MTVVRNDGTSRYFFTARGTCGCRADGTVTEHRGGAWYGQPSRVELVSRSPAA